MQLLTAPHTLATMEGRRAFLLHLVESGSEGLFRATNMAWRQLAEPRSTRCCAMALCIGVGGRGRVALFRVLGRFLWEIEQLSDAPLPHHPSFTSDEAWNDACLRFFADCDHAFNAIVDKYEAVIDGRFIH